MDFFSDNKAVNGLVGLDSDLLVNNFMNRSIIPAGQGINLDVETSVFEDIEISLKAGLYGMANNAINIGNFFGGDYDTYNIAEEMADLGAAYLSSKDSYDLAGDIVTSFIPGTIAFKALNAAKLAKTGGLFDNTIGFFHAKAKSALDETAGIYRNSLSAERVKSLKRQALGYSVLDEAVAGAVIGASIEVSQNLGDILVDEDLTAMQKLAKFTKPVLVGSAIGAPFGGLEYLSLARNIVKPTQDVRKTVIAETRFAQLFTNKDRIAQPEYASNHILDEIDRIEAYTPPSKLGDYIASLEQTSGIGAGSFDPLIEAAKKDSINLAKNQYRRLVSELAAGSVIATRDFTPVQREIVTKLNELVEGNIGTVQGRSNLRNLMDNVYSVDVNYRSPADVVLSNTSKNKFRDVAVMIDDPTVSGVAGIQFKGFDFKMIPLTQSLREGTKKRKDINTPQSMMALNANHPAVINNLPKYTILNRMIAATDNGSDKALQSGSIVRELQGLNKFLKTNGIDALPETGLFASLARTKQLMEEDTNFRVPFGTDKAKFTTTMQGLFKSMEDANATQYLLEEVSAKWLNLNTLEVQEKGLSGLYGKDLSKINAATVVDKTTDLDGVQKVRYQLNKSVKKDKNGEGWYNKALEGPDATPEDKLKAWTRLEHFTIKALENGDTSVTLGNGAVVDFGYVYNKLRAAKAEAAVTLLKKYDGNDVLNTLGVEDMGTLMNKAISPIQPTAEQLAMLVKNPAQLNELTHIRLNVKTNMLSPEETLLNAAVESGRSQQQAQMRVAASKAVGEDLEEIFIKAPSLGYADEISSLGRFVHDTHLKGDLASFNYFSVYVGDMTDALAGRLNDRAKAEFKIDALHNGLLNNPETAGEVAAYLQWYRTQSDKFETIPEADGSLVMLDLKTSEKYLTYRSQQIELAEEVMPVEAWVKQEGITTSNSYTITNPDAAEYVNTIQKLNYEKVMGPKNIQEEALGNTVNDESRYAYMPQRDLQFSRFFRVQTTDPMGQTSSTLYKVHSNSKRGIAKEVEEAEKYFKSKGIDAIKLDGTDAATQSALKLEKEWDGIQIVSGKVDNNRSRDGAHPDFRLDTAQEIIASTNAWIERSTRNIATASTELHYADEISKLKSMTDFERRHGEQFADTVAGQVEGAAKPGTFDTLHRQMLGRAEPFSLYNKANNWVSETMASNLEFAHEVRLKLRDKLSSAGQLTREDIMEADRVATKALTDRGLEAPLGKAITSYLNKETTLTGQDVNEAVASLQNIASTLLLRIDGIDPIMNLLGTTVKLSSEMKYIQDRIRNSGIREELHNDVYVKWFGAGKATNAEGIDISLMSPAKAMATGISDMFDGTARKFLDDLEGMGIYKTDLKIRMELTDDLVIPADLSTEAQKARWLGRLRDAVGKGVGIATTPHKATVDLSQYVALKFASDLADAAGVDIATKRMLMSGMNHRVNAISSHRSKPQLFQGLVGNAVSLYQSYFSHTVGNIVRHSQSVGSGPVLRHVAMNSTFFGAQSTPAFDMINAMVASQQDANNVDLYSAAYDLAGDNSFSDRSVADALMFGVGSAILRADLSSRGDMTPRYKAVIPTTVGDLPLVGAIVNTMSAVLENTYKGATGQQSFTQSVANTVIDSKLNRPLSGLMHVLAGKTTDSRSSLISTHDEMFSWGNAVRLAGAKPLDEARVNQAYWNLQNYRLKDRERTTNLRNMMKQEFQSNPEVMSDGAWINSKYDSYIRAGGKGANFDRFYQETVLQANTTFEQRLQVSVKDLDVAKNYKNVLGID